MPDLKLRKIEVPYDFQTVLGSDVYAYTPAQFADFWASEVKRYADVVRLSGATPE